METTTSDEIQRDSSSFDTEFESISPNVTEACPLPADHSATDSNVQQLCWQIIRKSNSHRYLADQLRQFVNMWSRALAADQVILVCQQRGKQRVLAVSGAASFDVSSPALEELEELSATQEQSVSPEFWASANQNHDAKPSLIETYTRSNGFRSAAMIPLVPSNQESPIGHVFTFSSAASLNEKQILQFSDELFPVLADQILIGQRADGNRLSRFLQKAKRYIFGQKKICWLIAGLLLTAILLFPVPYKVGCSSVLEPNVRRFVACPFDARLKEILVEPGSEVAHEQILALLNGDEFHLKLQAATAEYEREKEKHSAALQEGRISDAQVASLEMQKLQHDMQYFSEKMANLKIKSPIDGIVVSGDLKKSVGTPLEKGQSLFEIGPLDLLNIEIEIPESEIRFIKQGQPVEIRFHAFPLKTFSATLDRVYPRAEVRNDQVVFVALAQLENTTGLLRPGMAGQVSIDTGVSTIAWNLFHRPAEKLRSFIGF